MGPAVGHEGCGEDVAVAGELSLAGRFLEQQLEAIALLQIAVEVDLAAEDVGQRHRQLNVLAGLPHRGNERRVLRVDAPADRQHVRFLLERHDLGIEDLGAAAVAADDPQELVGVDLVLELAEETVERQDQPIRAVGPEPPGIEHRGCRLHRRVHQVGRQLVLSQQAVERGVAGHPGFDDRGLRRQQDVSGRAVRRRLRGRGARRRRTCHEGEHENSAEHEVSAV
jgi:hypothetical protein